MHPDAPYFSILLCLTQYTRQVESAATHCLWRVLPLNPLNSLSGKHPTLVFTLSNARVFYSV